MLKKLLAFSLTLSLFGALFATEYDLPAILKLAEENSAKFLLGSPLRIQNRTLSTRGLTEYFNEENGQMGLSSLVEAKRFAETLTIQSFREGRVDSRIARFDHLDHGDTAQGL